MVSTQSTLAVPSEMTWTRSSTSSVVLMAGIATTPGGMRAQQESNLQPPA